MKDDPTIVINDLMALGYCNRSARPWFAQNNLDWNAFLDHGLPASVMLATGDALIPPLVEVARKRIAG